MRLSLIVPAHAEDQNLITDFLQNVDSFFARLPFELELLLILDRTSPDQQNSLKQLPLAGKAIWEFNHPHLGRAASVEKGIRQASGDILVILTVDNAVPLAEIITVLQEMLQSADWDILVGNRFTSRKKLLGQRSQWHRVLEDIVHEKAQLALPKVTDPTCSFLAITRQSRDRLFSDKQRLLKSWFYSVPLLKAAAALNLKIQEVPIQFRKNEKSRVPLIREFLHHLF